MESARWCYVEPGGINHSDVKVCMTEAEILETYFPYWSDRMRRAGKEAEISPDECIRDWVVVNWAGRE